MLIKSYNVISLLNCIGRISEKVIAKRLSQFCKRVLKLHLGQMVLEKKYVLLVLLYH